MLEIKMLGESSPQAYISRNPYIISFVVYLAIALLRFPDIALHITSTIPGANGDALQNLWGMWWVPYAMFHLHQNIYYTYYLFWPIGANLLYQTMSPLGSLLSFPLQSISLPFAYNTLFFLGFPLSGIGMLAFADYITGSKRAAFLAGLIYTFSAAHIAQAYTRIDWMVIGWVPVTLLFLLKMIKEEKVDYYNVAFFSAFFLIGIFIGDIEQGVIAAMLYLSVIIACLLKRESRKLLLRKATFLQLALAAMIILALGSELFLPALSLIASPSTSTLAALSPLAAVNQLNTIPFNVENSLDVFSFILPDFYGSYVPLIMFNSYYWTIFSVASIEKTAYLTITAMALCIIGIVRYFRKSMLWLGIMVVFGWLALGPFLVIGGNITYIPGPYLIYHSIPLLNIVREPDRFIGPFIIAFSLCAAYGYIAIEKSLESLNLKLRPNGRHLAVLFAVSLLFLIETNGYPISNSATIFPFNTTPSIPPLYYALNNMPGNFSILALPAMPTSSGIVNTYPAEIDYYSTVAHKPFLGGYVTRSNYTQSTYLYYVPLASQATGAEEFGNLSYLSPINESSENLTLLSLYDFDTGIVTINKQAYNSTTFPLIYDYAESMFGQPVYNDNYITAFSVGRAINESIFNSFVSYPLLVYWNYDPVLYQGKQINAWIPLGQGYMRVYAPYPFPANASTRYVYNGTAYHVNATMRFHAIADNYSGEQLYIDQISGNGAKMAVASLDIAPTPGNYTVELHNLTSGKFGNYLLFFNAESEGSSNSSDVLIYNVTISRS